jgi:uncharacterized secreted repeat protein (TIGR03808 family)
MPLDRRHFVALGAVAYSIAAPRSVQARAGTAPAALGAVDATQVGVRPGSPDDQTRVLQRAIDESARTRAPLALAPGVYRAGDLKFPAGAQVVGIRGATSLLLTQGPSLVYATGADHVTLSGLVLDGGGRSLPERRGLVQLENCAAMRVTDCEIRNCAGSGLVCTGVGGEVTGTAFTNISDVAIHVLDSAGLVIARNAIDRAGNNGIQVWRSASGDDGTMVVDNRIENIANRSGGSGQYGNAINIFRAANVIVRGNRIKNCAFTAVRGNAASNLHIEGNSISDVREVALYAEFGFEGAIITNNTVDGAAIGVAVTNFNEGGRLAVVQGNLIRNLLPRRPPGTDPGDAAGVGISVEADSAVTGNVVEKAPSAGIMVGWGRYLRDIAVTGNVVRGAYIGIAVSVAPGAGTTVIANNMIAETSRGAVVGMSGASAITGDLLKTGAEQYANIALSGNRVR